MPRHPTARGAADRLLVQTAMTMRRFCLIVCATALFAPRPASAIVILAPAEHASVAPGAMVTVRVGPSPGESLESVAVGLATATQTATPLATQPDTFEASVVVPPGSVGPDFILALATLTSGTTRLEFIEINVEPGRMRQLLVTAPPTMSTVGQIYVMDVRGLFEDGVIRDVTNPDRGTTYASSDSQVVGVDPSGLLQARANGTALVRVTNRGVTATASVTVSIPPPVPPAQPNHIPIANAGPPQTVAPESIVILSGAATADPDGDPIEYRWAQTDGRAVILRDDDTAEPSFVSPAVTVEEVLEFSLVVSDTPPSSRLGRGPGSCTAGAPSPPPAPPRRAFPREGRHPALRPRPQGRARAADRPERHRDDRQHVPAGAAAAERCRRSRPTPRSSRRCAVRASRSRSSCTSSRTRRSTSRRSAWRARTRSTTSGW